MAFLPSGLTLWSNPPSPPQFGLPQWWGYSTTDTMATVAASGYFNLGGAIFPSNQTFLVGDQLYCYCSDGVASLQIATLTPNITTTASAADIPAGSITHAMLGSQIVQAGNIANATITTTQISASAAITGTQIASATIAAGNIVSGTITHTQISNTAAITGSQLSASAAIAGTQLAANTIASASLDLTTIQYVKVPVTAAQFKAIYGTPLVLIAAPASGLAIVVKQAIFAMTFVSAQYTDGGVVTLQYDSTVHGLGTAASETIAAATINGYDASSSIGVAGAMASAASSTIAAKGLYLSAQTQEFASGDGSFNLHIWYEIVTL